MQISIETVLGAYMFGRNAENGAVDALASNLILAEMASGRPSDLTLKLMHHMGELLLARSDKPADAPES